MAAASSFSGIFFLPAAAGLIQPGPNRRCLTCPGLHPQPQSIWRPLSFTIRPGKLSTLLTLIIGLPGAWLFAHYTFPGKRTLKILTTLPFILPTVVVAAGFNALLGPRGWVNLGLMALLNLETPPIQFLNTFGAILVAHVFYNTTIIIRVVSNAWSQQNIRLKHAAQVLGASPLRTFREVTLPLLNRPSSPGRCWCFYSISPVLAWCSCWAVPNLPPWRWRSTSRRCTC
jgi:ABC-type Fe3+ transport system permease subunit